MPYHAVNAWHHVSSTPTTQTPHVLNKFQPSLLNELQDDVFFQHVRKEKDNSTDCRRSVAENGPAEALPCRNGPTNRWGGSMTGGLDLVSLEPPSSLECFKASVERLLEIQS